MARKLWAIAALHIAVAFPASAAPVYPGQDLASQAQLPLREALMKVYQVRPGKITGRQLEHAPGGSGLRYSFDVESQGKRYKVGIDANTGEILENAPESVHPH